MPKNGESRGVLPQIIATVVVALLVGSTAPWWWNEIFHKRNDVIPPTSPNPLPKLPPLETVDGGQIQVQCTASPHSIPAGGQLGIRVLAFTEQSFPVSNAHIRIDSGGGWFSASGTTTEVGQTDSGGVFMTQWRSPTPAATAYGMDVTVTKNGFTGGRGVCNVPIQ